MSGSTALDDSGVIADVTITSRKPPIGGMTVIVGGMTLTDWVSGEVTRHMKEISGSFTLTYVDDLRAVQAGLSVFSGSAPVVREGRSVQIKLDGELVLDGWIDEIELEQSATELRATIEGRDKTGDLVDCAAAPNGPGEFTNIDLLGVAQAVCKPFGISVRADTDMGDPFPRLAVGPHEKALAFLEKAARQRSVLLASDGVGGLLLTTAGTTQGSPLVVGVNVTSARTSGSWRQRFSDVFVKGQTDSRARRAGRAAALDHDSAPAGSAPSVPDPDEASTALIAGHAKDTDIDRWRPTVRLTRTQSGASSAQTQAEWAVRVERGQSRSLHYRMPGWRSFDKQELFRPNTVCAVYDPYSGIDDTMLIAGVTYQSGPEGVFTEIDLVGVTAYDRINEADRRRQRHRGKPRGGPLDGSAPSIDPDSDEEE